jgi:hypothetical protein
MIRQELITSGGLPEMGAICPPTEPNIIEDTLFIADNKIIGFYLKQLPEPAKSIANLANSEFRSTRVPKSEMRRNPTDGIDMATGKYKYKHVVAQYSTILGGVPPKPHMRRIYPTISSVHEVKSAELFIKAMIKLAKECEKIIADIMPEAYNEVLQIMKNVDPKWKLTDIFTSSISNYNIAAAYHRDTANIPGALNVIVTKRLNASGGCLNIPEYGATVAQEDNSLLVYPAWRDLHGVTPITALSEGGYRNSLIFYSLKTFLKN